MRMRMVPLLVAALALMAGCRSSKSYSSKRKGKGEKTITELTQELLSDHAGTRRAAARELGRRGDEAIYATEMLQAVADSDPDPKVRAEAEKAIEKIVGPIGDG